MSLAAIAGATVVAVSLAPAANAEPKGFKYGVTAGDVSSSSAVLWAKAKKSGKVLAQISHKGGFGACKPGNAVAKVKAKGGHDNTVTALLDDLKAETSYKYRFCTQQGGRSATGHFTTAPNPKSKHTIRFGFSGDQDARPVPGGTTPYWNNFQIWDAIRQQRNDFNVLMGDTIYSDTEVPGYTLADVALTKQQKWSAYKTNLGMKPWTKTRGSTAYYAHWDDHEFINNFAVGENTFPLGVGTVNRDGEQLYTAGRKAFTDYNPVSYSKDAVSTGRFAGGRTWRSFSSTSARSATTSLTTAASATTRPGAGIATWRRRRRRARATSSRPSFLSSPTPCHRAVSRPSTTRTGRCSGPSSCRPSRTTSRHRRRRSRWS